MVNLLESLDALFGTVNLYEVLGLEKSASASQIKKAYYKLSLEVHPDRVTDEDEENRENATKKFQTISQVYTILSNSEKRALYDDCGEIDLESGILEENRDWDSYWRILFKKITIADIEKFQDQYRFSEEEKHDVITAYVQCEGDMDAMLEVIPCSVIEDDVRFKQIVDEKIREGDVVLFDAFRKENSKTRNKRRKSARNEEEEAKRAASEIGLNSEGDALKMMIQKRQKDREQEMDSFFDHLASKYGNPNKKVKNSSKKESKMKKSRK